MSVMRSQRRKQRSLLRKRRIDMQTVKAGFEILTPISDGGIKELQHIEKIGRVCYKSEDKITEDGESAKKFVSMLINNHHEAMLEHGVISVLFTVDRGVTHEMVRKAYKKKYPQKRCSGKVDITQKEYIRFMKALRFAIMDSKSSH